MADTTPPKGAPWGILFFVFLLLVLLGTALGIFFQSSLQGFAEGARIAHANKDAIMFAKWLFHEAGMWIAMAIVFIAVLRFMMK